MSASSGEKVAARLSPPDSIRMRSRSRNRFRISSIAARFIEASSRIAVCGPPREPPRLAQNAGVLLGVDVVGDRGDVEFAAQPLAELLHQRGLARADRATDA